MTVLEMVKKFGISDYEKTYKDTKGNKIGLTNLDKLKGRLVLEITINTLDKKATITVI